MRLSDIFKPVWQSKDFYKVLRAVKKLSTSSIIAKISLDKSYDQRLHYEAILKLSDNSLLAIITKKEQICQYNYLGHDNMLLTSRYAFCYILFRTSCAELTFIPLNSKLAGILSVISIVMVSAVMAFMVMVSLTLD